MQLKSKEEVSHIVDFYGATSISNLNEAVALLARLVPGIFQKIKLFLLTYYDYYYCDPFPSHISIDFLLLLSALLVFEKIDLFLSF
tara:strand:- start:514 stop:771 length:258 start_codon:yes stop_codon:yes gene_type:complete